MVKIFLCCNENFAHAQQKNIQTQEELVFSSETDGQKNNMEEGGELENAGSACRVSLGGHRPRTELLLICAILGNTRSEYIFQEPTLEAKDKNDKRTYATSTRIRIY